MPLDIKLTAQDVLQQKRQQFNELKIGNKKHHIYVDGKLYESFDKAWQRTRHMKTEMFRICGLRNAKLVELISDDISSHSKSYDVYYKDGYSSFRVGKKSIRCDV